MAWGFQSEQYHFFPEKKQRSIFKYCEGKIKGGKS